MRKNLLGFALVCVVFSVGGVIPCGLAEPALAQQNDVESLRAGKSFRDTEVYAVDEDRQMLAYFDGLRVAIND